MLIQFPIERVSEDTYQSLPFYKASSAGDKALIDATQKRFRGDIARVTGETQSKWYAYASPIWAVAHNVTESISQYLWIDSDMWTKLAAFRPLSRPAQQPN